MEFLDNQEEYKKLRTSLEKSFIIDLENQINKATKEWNETAPLMRTINAHKYEEYMDDLDRKLKEEVVGLRAIKKKDPDTILNDDINMLQKGIDAIPTSKNPFDWITNFRHNFIELNCFTRMALFGTINIKNMYDYDIIKVVHSIDLPNLDGTKEDKIQTITGLITRAKADKNISVSDTDNFDYSTIDNPDIMQQVSMSLD